jgi:hypothetical protein
MKTVFICGPYTTIIDEYKESYKRYKHNLKVKKIIERKCIEENINIAIKAAQYLYDHAYNVFCPHVAIAGYMEDKTDSNPENYRRVLEMCFQWIEKCDFFALLPGWNESAGCKEELSHAIENDKYIMYLTYERIGV